MSVGELAFKARTLLRSSNILLLNIMTDIKMATTINTVHLERNSSIENEDMWVFDFHSGLIQSRKKIKRTYCAYISYDSRYRHCWEIDQTLMYIWPFYPQIWFGLDLDLSNNHQRALWPIPQMVVCVRGRVLARMYKQGVQKKFWVQKIAQRRILTPQKITRSMNFGILKNNMDDPFF